MIVYKLAKRKFANDLSGKGAELCGGRWNSKGVAMVYTSESRALATTEIALHISMTNIPTDYYIISIEILEDSIYIPEINTLPKDWTEIPPKIASQKFGDKFIRENNYLVLKVPSVVVEDDYNYLINPWHKDISKVRIVKISSFSFDKRLFG